MAIDINSDLGESFGNYKMGNDAEIMKYITSANIACGFHAGDPLVMEKTILSALENNVSIGAHPSYPDLVGFGRRSLKVGSDELFSMTLYQVGALKSMTEALGGQLQHVKPHGALYNDLSYDYKKAKVFSEAVYKIDPGLILVGLANSEMLQAARDTGLVAVSEYFADRTYNDDGSLLSRTHEGAVIEDTEICLSRVKQMIEKKTVSSINGNDIDMEVGTICVHGDNEKALEFVKSLKVLFSLKNLKIKNLKELTL